MGEEAPAAGGFSRQFHPQTYSFTLDKAQRESGIETNSSVALGSRNGSAIYWVRHT